MASRSGDCARSAGTFLNHMTVAFRASAIADALRAQEGAGCVVQGGRWG